MSFPRGAFVALFAVSGFAGLIYESIWTQYLKLFLGHAAYAQTLVLAIFMGGMALGAWFTGAWSGRIRNLLLGYAVVEGLIGFAAIVFHGVFVAASDFTYDQVLPALSSPAGANAVKWALGALFILPQSVLLGMTFPLMTGGILRRYPGAPGRSLAALYFANSFGAAIGVLASGFVLIDRFGLPGTILTAGLINVALALVVWLIARGGEPRSNDTADAAGAPAWHTDRVARVMLLAAGVTGAASFLYEIAWIRMLTLVLGAATHSFELMLAAFILGLALGSLYVRRRIDRIADPMRYLGWVQLLMGGCALATLLVYGYAFDWMAYLMGLLARTEEGYAGYTVVSSLIALVVMLPATFFAGMTLPLITLVLYRRGVGERAIGAVYAANTVGAIIGILAAVHLLMPAAGVKGVVTIGAALDLALGVAMLALAFGTLRMVQPMAGAAAALAAVALTVALVQLDPHRMLSGVYRSGKASAAEGATVLYRRDGKTASIGVVRHLSGVVAMSTNGKTDASLAPPAEESAPDEATMVLLGALPLAYHPRAKTVANIGFGSGLTTHVLLGSRRLERVDTIEIEPAVIEASRSFGAVVGHAYEDPRSRVHIEDAKTFFATRNARYDIIVSEPSNPWVSGVSSLFSSEFYARARRHLAPDGVFVQWLQAYEINMPLIASILKALGPHFGEYVLYSSNDSDLVLVARAQGDAGRPDAGVLAEPALAKALARIGIAGIEDLELRRLGNRRVIDAAMRSYPVPANSDYFPILDQSAARARFALQSIESELGRLRVSGLPLMEMLEGRSPSSAATRATRTPHSVRANLTNDAVNFHAALTGSGDWSRVERATLREWTLMHLLMERCDPGTDWTLWRDALRTVMFDTLPYLTAAEGTQIVARVRAHACAARLPEAMVRWLDLYEAIARREAGRMHTLAAGMLEAGDGATRPELRVLLVNTALLGAVAASRPQDALAIWTKRGRAALEGTTLLFDTRILLALANSNLTRSAPGTRAPAAR